MPADLMPNDVIAEKAARVDSPAMLRALQQLQENRFVLNDSALDRETADALQQLSAFGLADPGYHGPTNGTPFIWVGNLNGERVLRHLLESKLKIDPRAGIALATLSGKDRIAVVAAAVALQARSPASLPSKESLCWIGISNSIS